MKFNFVYDKYINGKPYPNLAQAIDISKGYESLWSSAPYIIPLRLLYYLKNFSYPVDFYYVDDDYPNDSFYPIGIAWYSLDIDYIELLSHKVKKAVGQGRLRLMFYYHEGDNPLKQKKHLDDLCDKHQIPKSYKFITGNTAISGLNNFVYFPDHERFYFETNLKHSALEPHFNQRSKDFTALNRVHKWWRATAMTHLHVADLLNNSYWSYGGITCNDNFANNPIDIHTLGLGPRTLEFVSQAPYVCDTLSSDEHNQHHTLVPEHFTNSYFNIVFETFFDTDQSGGAFLTEKTFKPIKHAQPFILVAPAGSLALLRKLGYKTFDNAIDNRYDSIINNTSRWLAIFKLVSDLKKQNLQKIFNQCRDDIIHNQHRFLTSGTERLDTLLRELNK